MSRSIASRVGRTYVLGVVLASLSIVLASGVAGSLVVMERDDAEARALARTLGSELVDHEDPSTHDRVVRHELEEMRPRDRRIEVWREGARVGGAQVEGLLGAFATREAGCGRARVGDAESRVCVAPIETGEVIVVASAVAPMLAGMAPMLGVVALAAIAAALVFGVLGRRAIAGSLAPLPALADALSAMPARASTRRVRATWSAAEIDSLAASFNAALARVDEAVAREQRFVADAAHELRTPLTRLSAQLELAREEAREGGEVEARLGAAIRSTRELVDLTEALLAMAQGEAGQTEAVDLGDVVTTCIARLDPSEASRVRVHREGDDPIARGIEPLITLAVANLIDNALKYGAGDVQVSLCQRDGRVWVDVDDHGPGIPEAELEAIRAPFVRGSTAGERRGTGIGLALVDHVARMHEGSLELANRTPKGFHAGLRVRAWVPAAE